MKHIRAGVLALRIIGVILIAFNGFDIIRCILGIIVDNGGVAYISSIISSGLILLVGVAMIIAAGIIKKKFIN